MAGLLKMFLFVFRSLAWVCGEFFVGGGSLRGEGGAEMFACPSLHLFHRDRGEADADSGRSPVGEQHRQCGDQTGEATFAVLAFELFVPAKQRFQILRRQPGAFAFDQLRFGLFDERNQLRCHRATERAVRRMFVCHLIEHVLQSRGSTTIETMSIDETQAGLHHFFTAIPSRQIITKTAHPAELLVHPLGCDALT